MPPVDTVIGPPVGVRAPAPFRPDRVPPVPPPRDGGDGDRPKDSGSPLPNAQLGMLVLFAAEGMFFGGMVAAFLHLRLGAATWPPPGQPRLPVGLTALNTLVLLASSYTVARALGAGRAGDPRRLVGWLRRTLGLGVLFLAVQGVEWVRLVHFGLTASSGAYGSTFYTLIGTHGAHVLGAVVWLAVVLVAAGRGRYTPSAHVGLTTCAMYWHFVVAVWPILYILVYLLA